MKAERITEIMLVVLLLLAGIAFLVMGNTTNGLLCFIWAEIRGSR